MELHEELRLRVSREVISWCHFAPLDVVITTDLTSLSVIEAATGCINKVFQLSELGAENAPICMDVIGKQKLAISSGNVFNCRSKFNDVILCDSILQTMNLDCSGKCCIDLPMPEALMLIEALKVVKNKWDIRADFGFECSLDLTAEETSDNVWKWNLVRFACPYIIFYEWLTEINGEMIENFPSLPLVSSIIYRIKSLQMSDYEIRLSIYDRFKEVMNIEANRFLSFEMWPHKTYKWATPELMAKVGFYHHPRRLNDDRALCFLCNICLITWEATDEPWSEHQRHSPNCPLFKHNFTSNVPLSITEATTTAQKSNSPKNIILIAKSSSSRFVATISEDGHVCVWDTCYLFRKVSEFDTPIFSKDGSMSIDSACLVDNSFLLKSSSNDSEEKSSGFHLVLGTRFVPESSYINKFLQSPCDDCADNVKLNYVYNKQCLNQEASFIIVIEIAYHSSLINQDEKITLPEYNTEEYRLNTDEEMAFEEHNEVQYPDNEYIVYKPEPVTYGEKVNVNNKQSFLGGLSLFRLWNESKSLKECSVKVRDSGDTSVIHVLPLMMDEINDFSNDFVRISSIHTIIMENDEESFDTDPGSSVYLMVNVSRDFVNDTCSVGGALFVYKFQVENIKEFEGKSTVTLLMMSSIILSAKENIESMFPISFESLESNCSESSSTANVDDIQQEQSLVSKTTLNKSSFHWLLLSNNGDLYLYSMTFNNIVSTFKKQSLLELAIKINVKKELPGKIIKLLLFSDMDRLCLLTDDGVMAFYTIIPKKKLENSLKEINGITEKLSKIKQIEINTPALAPMTHITQDPLFVEQSDIVDRLNVIFDFIQYEMVTSRLKLTYGCNWVEVSPLEIIDFKTNVNNFINMSRSFTSKSTVQSDSSFSISGSQYMKTSDQHQCCTRTLNFRASQTCSREQIIEFSTAKQLCIGHVDMRFELYDKMNKNSNFIYITLLRQQKFNSQGNSKDQSNGSIKVNTSPESNVIVNDLEAPYIDDDLAQYYDEVNADILRKLDEDIVAGPYLLNKYCQSDSTSIFLSMTSAELLKCRSRHYAIHIRVCGRASSEERKSSNTPLNNHVNQDSFPNCESLNLNIKSISLTLRRFSKPLVSVRNERSQRLAILRNHKFLTKLFDLLVGETTSKLPRPLVLQHSLDIINWIVVMHLNDIKPHNERIHKVISIASAYLQRLILIHLVQGDRYTSKMMSKILNGLIKLESRYWSLDNRPSITHESCYFILSKTTRSILQYNIDWLLLSTNSVAVHSYLLLLDNLDKLPLTQHQSNFYEELSDFSLVSKLSLLFSISQRYSKVMDNDEYIYLKTILGYGHNPLTGDLFDMVSDVQSTKTMNTLHMNLTEMYKKKPAINLDSSNNDSISKYLMHTFHDHSLKHIQEQLNEQISSMEEKVSTDFTIHDLQKVYHKMVMTNVSNNIQLMSPKIITDVTPPLIQLPDSTEVSSSNTPSMTWPGFDPFLLSKMNPKQIIYSDMKKKMKSAHYLSSKEPIAVLKSNPTAEYSYYKINPTRKSSMLEGDVLPVFFESGSEGTFLESSDYNDTPGKDQFSYSDYSPNITIPLMHIMDDHSSLPVTPKTTPAITTQTTPMQNSPLHSPSSLEPLSKSEMLETSSIMLDDINQQRLKFSQQTNNLLMNPCAYFMVVNRLHANARRHAILDLRQPSVITDIVIPSSDKLQKIIIRIGRTKNEDEMQTIVVHSKIATEPLLLLNIQPQIVCSFVQIVVIAKSNITATRNRINIGHLYGRPAILPWEMINDISVLPSKSWCDMITNVLEQLRPQAETITIRYNMTSDTLRHLLNKCIKTGIDQRILSQSLSEHHSKTKSSFPKISNSLVPLINQVNDAYSKCCHLQQHSSIINNQMKQLQTWLSMADVNYKGYSMVDDQQKVINTISIDKQRVLMEFLLESLLLDDTLYFEIDSLENNMKLISGIMTNILWHGNREMQIMTVSWIPKLITKSSDIAQALRVWSQLWLSDFLLNTFTNKNISLLCLNKEEIFSLLCIIFQKLSNAGYHYQLLENVLDIVIMMLQHGPESGDDQRCSVDIELLNWMMLIVDFILSWIDKSSANSEEQFFEWKFMFWNKNYHGSTDPSMTLTADDTKDKLNYLKQSLLHLNSHKESFVDYVKKCQYDPWFSQLIMNEYLDSYVKLSLKVNTTITKMKKSLSINKGKKVVFKVKKDEMKKDLDPFLIVASSSIATTIKLMLNTLKCMDFKVSQDTFILTCMILNKLFVLSHQSGILLNNYIDNEAIFSLIQRAFSNGVYDTSGLDVYSLHACKLLLSEIVYNDIYTLTKNDFELEDELCLEVQEKVSMSGNSQEDNDNEDSVNNDEEEDVENEEEDITPTGADDEDININPDEPYTFYITQLGNLAKQKAAETIKNVEESPSDEYVDIVEEFDFLGQPTPFIPTYHKTKVPLDYQSAFKALEVDKQIITNALDSVRLDKSEFDSSHSVLYYDIRLENTIFCQQEVMFNNSLLNWMHQVRVQLYSQISQCTLVTKGPISGYIKTPKTLTIGYILESVNRLLDDDVCPNLEEIVIFLLNICYHLQREKLLVVFDSMDICQISIQYLLDKTLTMCSSTLPSLPLYCQLICFLLSFDDYLLKSCHFKRIFQLADSLQLRELDQEIVSNFRTIIMKLLENKDNKADFFLEILYSIIDNGLVSDLQASGQLASVIVEHSKSTLIEYIEHDKEAFSTFITKIISLTKSHLHHDRNAEDGRCFTSLVPRSFSQQLLQIEMSLTTNSVSSSLSETSPLLQLNIMLLELIKNTGDMPLSLVDHSLLQSLLETVSKCTSNILENSKFGDVIVVSENLVKHSQNVTLADVVWKQLVRIAYAILSTSQSLTTDLLNSLLTVLQQSLPNMNEPLFLVSIWLLKSVRHPEDVDYIQLLTAVMSVIISFSESRLSNTPLNTVTTRLAIAKMHKYNALQVDPGSHPFESHISNSSRLNVAPYCKISCRGNDSNDSLLLSRLLVTSVTKSSITTLRSNRLKQADLSWSYDFFPHETHVEIVITLPCDMIVHKIVLLPKSIREFSTQFELTTVRDCRDTATVTYKKYHKPLSYNDGILIENINSNRLSNKIILRFEKPISSKLTLSKIEIFSINQWWDHRFQVSSQSSNLCVFRCLHLFNYLVGVHTPNTVKFVVEALHQNRKFFSILLNWNQVHSLSSELVEKRTLNKSICNLVVRLFLQLGQRLESYSTLFINEILTKVSLRQSQSSSLTNFNIHFSNEISVMELNIFYYLLTLNDKYSATRLRLVLQWFVEHVMKEESTEKSVLIYQDSVASLVYLLSIVLWNHNGEIRFNHLLPDFMDGLQVTLHQSGGYLKKALYRLLCSVCAIDQDLYTTLIKKYPIINAKDNSLNHDNLKFLLWASRSKLSCTSLKESGICAVLVSRIIFFLDNNSDSASSQVLCSDVCTILDFLAKLCLSGCNSIKIWLGCKNANSFWSILLDYLINDNLTSQSLTLVLKTRLIKSSVKFFKAVTLCCDDNQTIFVNMFIESMEKYRMKPDTIVLSNSLRQLILEVIVKEPLYSVVIDMPETYPLLKQFPGWLIFNDEFGRRRLSFKHPGLGNVSKCILVDKLPLTNTVSSLLSLISSQVMKPKRIIPSESAESSSCTPRIFDLRQSVSNLKIKRPSISNDVTTSFTIKYQDQALDQGVDLFDLLTQRESQEDFSCGFISASCSLGIHDQSLDEAHFSSSKVRKSGYLLCKFTECGGLKLLSMMLPLLYTDIRRVSSISGSSYRPTTTSMSSNMGFMDDEVIIPTETSKTVKTLPLIPAHSITALCLFLQIDLYPLYLIQEQQYRSALIHLLLGITDDDCGVSLIQSCPQLQCVPFTILSDLLRDSSLSPENRNVIIHQCIELGLIDFFISLLSIFGHVDSGLLLHSFRSSGPWASFISQSLCDLHYQLFSATVNVEKSDAKPVTATVKSTHSMATSLDSKSPYITFMPFIDEKKNYWAKGTGFGTGGMYSTWDSEYVLLRQRLEETNASAILDTLSTFISPSDEEVDNLKLVLDQNEDNLPMKAAESIYTSTLLSFICCYLRNDSVLDVSQHVNIYKSVLKLIRATAKHRCLHYLLFPHLNPADTNPDFIYSLNQTSSISSINVSQLLFQLKICVDTYINRLKKAPCVSTKSTENNRKLTRQFSVRRKNVNYSSLLQRINDVSKTSKEILNDAKDDQKGAESENLTLLIPEINNTLKLLEGVEIDISERNKRREAENLKLMKSDYLHNNTVYCLDENGLEHCDIGKSSRDLESKYLEVMKKLQFGMFEMISPSSDDGKFKFSIPYHFKKNVENAVTSQSSAVSLSRARRLAQETVTLSTSLPLSYSSSVFVRCDENHLDIMKVIIIGPPETPYANGCFEFDVYFPPDYPKTPPLLNLQTTGNGSVRFNPNLYNEGKVCLSILNTWHGRPEERWSSRTSSFLQVLVSIQSLILVSEPYFNEPGYERSRGTPSGNNASKAYSANIQAATSRWAILEMMKNPPLCFSEVIKKHFLLKKDEIITQIQSWIDTYLEPSFDPALFNNTRPSIANSVQNLKKNLILVKKEFDNLEKEDLSL